MTNRKDSCNRGIAFHIHHDLLVEWCSDYNKRVEEIKETKAPEEQALRLQLFKLIPANRLTSKLITACKAYNKAQKAYIKALKTPGKPWEARDKILEACIPQLGRLHGELCPHCPWDGHTIFTRKNDAGEWY